MEISVIKDASAGNIKAFKKIFDYYVPRMRPVCLRYCHSVFEADDILQEAFVKIYHNLKDFKFEGSFEGWVRRIVVNTALNNYKKNLNFYAAEQLDEIKEAEIGWEDCREIEEAEPSRLMKIIEELPDGYRVVFNLYVLEDLPHKEIADMLGISEGTSRSQYAKAKKMIKKILSRQQNTGISTLVINKEEQNENEG
jgi:RNA polymerase sigma factor (sigma-70 family)